ncbi:MAG TPA: hypothetical protein PLK24_08005 [Atribacter sp.]|jgi:hypothetical protein|nr:hypothetical protein [Atribacterota bacterium]HQK83864.1 hypothetical protein [Atribacter sp.]
MNNNLPSEMKAKRFVRVRGFFMAFFLEQKTIYLDELLTIIIPHNAVEQ